MNQHGVTAGLVAAHTFVLAGCTSTALAPRLDEPVRLELSWAIEGNWTGVAVDPVTGDYYSMKDAGVYPQRGTWAADIWRVDRSGNKAGVVSVSERGLAPPEALLLGNVSGSIASEFIIVDGSGSIYAFDTNGAALWRQTVGLGIQDVCAGDVDGDGYDEMFLAVASRSGVVALNPNGKQRWRVDGLGNVWSVAFVASAVGGAPRIVVAHDPDVTSVFDESGRRINTIAVGDAVRVTWRSAPGEPVVIASSSHPLKLEAATLEGRRLWRVSDRAEADADFSRLAAAADEPWVAVAAWKTGRVIVYDVRNGERLTSVTTGRHQAVGWVPADGDKPPLLIVASVKGLQAFALPIAAQTDLEPGARPIR